MSYIDQPTDTPHATYAPDEAAQLGKLFNQHNGIARGTGSFVGSFVVCRCDRCQDYRELHASVHIAYLEEQRTVQSHQQEQELLNAIAIVNDLLNRQDRTFD